MNYNWNPTNLLLVTYLGFCFCLVDIQHSLKMCGLAKPGATSVLWTSKLFFCFTKIPSLKQAGHLSVPVLFGWGFLRKLLPCNACCAMNKLSLRFDLLCGCFAKAVALSRHGRVPVQIGTYSPVFVTSCKTRSFQCTVAWRPK